MTQKANASALTLVAVSEADLPLAYAMLGEAGHVDHLYCAPEAAGQGVAGLVYAGLEQEARELGIVRLHTEASEVALGFFLRRGFVLLHRRDFVIDGVAIHNHAMEKLLPPR